MDRLIAEYFEKSVKALDVCNIIRDGVELIRQWQRYLEIVLTALDSSHKTLGEGQFRRAKKALTDLTIAMLDEKDSGGVLALTSLTSILLEQFKGIEGVGVLQQMQNTINPETKHSHIINIIEA
ncbi:hypothetical protein IFM89_025528 [Coptis chinensis]|uniref:Uncharacterized protein n=1 Tax=Coptis chinensis TaxID=261450 RepID=A0A835H6L3_9MAGN|nr:hypothetical protein IFM89_025528 [Coptis chinensis]